MMIVSCSTNAKSEYVQTLINLLFGKIIVTQVPKQKVQDGKVTVLQPFPSCSGTTWSCRFAISVFKLSVSPRTCTAVVLVAEAAITNLNLPATVCCVPKAFDAMWNRCPIASNYNMVTKV